MKNRTVKITLILIGLLFLNIEAAQAGLFLKIRAMVGLNFPYMTMLIISAGLVGLGLICYALFDKSLNLSETQNKKR